MKLSLLTMSLLFSLISACASSGTKTNAAETPAPPAPATAAPGDRLTCLQNTDSRILEIKKIKDGGCELLYTKFGTERSVATSAGAKYCQEVREKISANLTRSGFKCD
jgi:hypothetical protein